jgi:hypothetical protein
MQTQRRLDDILGREIGLQWFESIALVQAVCEQVLAHGSSDAFPSAADIAVDADGSVTVLGQTGGPMVAAAGHLLAGMVGDDVPVRVRLAISEATATGSPYPHLAAFSEALAYFERPGRRELIAAVHARAAAAPSRSVARPIQAPEPKALPDGLRQEARSPRRRALVAVLLVAGTVVTAGVWIAPHHREVSGALSALVAAHSEQSVAPTEAIQVPGIEPPPPAKIVKVRARGRTTTLNPATTTLNLAKTSSDSLLTDGLVAPPIMVTFEVVEIQASAPEEAADVSVSDMRPSVYSRDDRWVSPPRPVRPQLPPEPPFDPTVAPPTELELVIDSTGLVESAKLRTPPRNVNEFMLVSAAKAWIFQPAEFDGRPVRYRHRVRLIMP